VIIRMRRLFRSGVLPYRICVRLVEAVVVDFHRMECSDGRVLVQAHQDKNLDRETHST
jgi:hypothetical protein